MQKGAVIPTASLLEMAMTASSRDVELRTFLTVPQQGGERHVMWSQARRSRDAAGSRNGFTPYLPPSPGGWGYLMYGP